ncbi:hypothetical protein FZEAL_7705 [Fusarium zealandicum]|uniref:Heterokaryon incompatibility domain-containing protein n=1 Tax=Fusarium zealandicum TaxID=1053134 RepID=A0A8H4UFX7_9HYPO|nr:hypothetical protein FZEAL_7705 [Fusarium zealandicum]
MSSSAICSACLGIFQGQYAATDVLAQHDILQLDGAAFVPSGFATDETEWRFRLNQGPELDSPPTPYLHHVLLDLVDSITSCVLCAMIWERLQRDIHPITLSQIEEESIVGIPVIQPGKSTFLGSFTLGLCFAKPEGDKLVARLFHSFRAFKAIGDEPVVKLVTTRGLGSSTKYAALSHRWGEVQPLMLLRDQVDAFHHGIPFASIPTTFQDAIKLANALDIEYLWIDSLCIIQDSKDDWHAEAAHMASVYSQACVTISATAAEDSAAGLTQNSMLRHPCEVIPTWTGFGDNEMPQGAVRLIDRSVFCDQVLSRPLFQRGWVFQEWILSTKTIHVARDQLWWTSASDMTSEGFASNETCNGYNFDINRNFSHTMPLGALYSLRGQNAESLQPVWHQLLQDYMTRSFTFESDRLVAFSGIGALYQALAQVPQDSYLAGIWRQSLLRDLLWTVKDGRKISPPQNYRVPSWSWASMEPTRTSSGKFGIGNININADLEEEEEPWIPAATVVDASVTTTGLEFGSVTDGHLVLQGPLIKAHLSTEMVDLSDQLTAEQAAEFLPGGNLRYIRNFVTLQHSPNMTADEADDDGILTKAQLDDVLPPFLSEKSVAIYLGVLYCRVDLDGAAECHALALVKGIEKGEYRRIGCVHIQEDIMDRWIIDRDFGVFDALKNGHEYLGVRDTSGLYTYRIV